MRRGRRTALVLAGALAPLLAGGCAGNQTASPITVLEPLPVMGVVTLGAGDALGRSIFIHDVILAAGERAGRRESIADVPVVVEDEAR